MFITNTSQLEEFVQRASTSDVLAIDTEFLREKTYFAKLCLIQLGTRTEQVAVDPLAIKDLSPLKKLFNNENIVKIFHSCSQDMEILAYHFDTLPKPVFDTQIAAGFTGFAYQIGYGNLVHGVCHVNLPKTESLTDWSRRPLDKTQMEYALDDVKYLPGIYDYQVAKLEETGRSEWIKPEMERLSHKDTYIRSGKEAYLKVKRTNGLTLRQMGVLRELAEWRDRLARFRNVPRKWVLTDETLVELARRSPVEVDRLKRTRGVTDALSDAQMQEIVEACRRGLEVPYEELPDVKKRNRPNKEQEPVIDMMYALLRYISESTGIATSVIASRDDLFEFLSNSDKSSLSSGWRKNLAGTQLRRLLVGEIGLTVKDGAIEIL